MSDDESRIDRRTALKTAGVAGAAALTGGIAVPALTGGAVAVGSQNLGPVAIETDDGEVKHVSIHGDSAVEWFGFDTPATHFDIVITLDVRQDESSVDQALPREIHATGTVDLSNTNWGSADESLSGPGTSGTIESAIGLDGGTHDPDTDWAIVQASDYSDPYGLPSNPVDATHLKVDGGNDTNDSTESFTLVMASTYTWYDGDGGAAIHSETFESEIAVDVTNLAADAEATSTDGGATGE